MSTNHTPGPWHWTGSDSHGCMITDERGRNIAEWPRTNSLNLLAALNARSHAENLTVPAAQARSALARAKGE